MFRDITTLLKHPQGFKYVIDSLAERYKGKKISKIVGIESRGFILGAPLAHQLGIGFVPARKPGKLPAPTVEVEYVLEYGKDKLQMHKDAVNKGEVVLIVDDLIATGGTACAVVDLVRKLGGSVLECSFIVDLPDLGGKKKLEAKGVSVFTMVEFEGD